MSVKSDYSSEEWQILLQAPGAAGIYIMMADPNFVIGSMKEAFALSAGILHKEKETDNSPLLSALLSEFEDREMVKKAQLQFEKKDLATIKKTAFNTLQQAVSILQEKATSEEAGEMTSWLYQMCVKVANAAKEGGFLGFGGTKVSDKEKAALSEVAQLLGVTP